MSAAAATRAASPRHAARARRRGARRARRADRRRPGDPAGRLRDRARSRAAASRCSPTSSPGRRSRPPASGAAAARRLGRLPRVRSDWRVAAGVGLLTLSALLAFRELGHLVERRARLAARARRLRRRAALGALARPSAETRRRHRGWAAARARDRAEPARRAGAATPTSRFADLYRGVFGVLLVVGAALLFLSSNHILGGLRDAALTAVVVVVAVGLILAPFLWRLGRNLAAERAERIRSQERAELAAHLHDSVLQTLTLMQKRADDPREVAALARRQERELRDWLAGGGRRAERRELRGGAALRGRGGRGRPPRRGRGRRGRRLRARRARARRCSARRARRC